MNRSPCNGYSRVTPRSAYTAGERFFAGAAALTSPPDLWIRNRDDGGTTHQAPIAGEDNWFHARVRNRGSGMARHFLVTFAVKQFAGVQFSWPADFLPAITAAAGFDLGPGQQQVVKARWPAALVPPAGAHACWLAAVLTRSDRPAGGTHVWEHGNLAQKNMTIVRARRGASVLVPFVARGPSIPGVAGLEIRRPTRHPGLKARIVALPRPADTVPDDDPVGRPADAVPAVAVTDAGVDDGPGSFADGPAVGQELALPTGPAALGLLLQVPADAKVGAPLTVDLVRVDRNQRVVGGLAVTVHVE